ncbi:MAG: glycosyltransferase, partial [Prevotella sp.]|nr:glycosyltransferase [Prevotella sp.]MDY4652909.1 glycosyltransferase [Prevotella sp.]
MKVSILVPVYNVEKYFARCLETLFSQTYSGIEYVFVNDCTPDKSMYVLQETLEKYPSRANSVKIIENKQNLGIAIVRNTLLENATGEYVLFVDSDDWIEVDAIEKFVDKALQSNADIVGCDYFEEYHDRQVLFKQSYPSHHVEAMKAMTLLRIKGVLWKLFMRRELIVHNNIYFVPEVQFGEDYIFCCKLFFYAKSFSCVDEALYHYVQYNPNNYCSTDSGLRIESFSRAITIVETFYREKGVYDILEKELLQRKFLSKSSYVLDAKKRDIKKWASYFPESNGAWRGLNYSLPNRIRFLLAEVMAKLFC